jgi:hypothetical protein
LLHASPWQLVLVLVLLLLALVVQAVACVYGYLVAWEHAAALVLTGQLVLVLLLWHC